MNRKRTIPFLLLMSVLWMQASVPAYGWHPGHDEHSAKHGGKVISIGEAHQHVEIAVRAGHQYDVYFSDSAQQDLPAAKFSNVTLRFTEPHTTVQQTLALHLSDDGEYWTGAAASLENTAQTSVKITCTYRGAVLSKDVLLFAPAAHDSHAHPHAKSAD